MTPAAIRAISQLRQEFYSLFAEAMKVPVKITYENSSISHLSTASWIDSQQRLNYVCIHAYTAPDELVPERPFILRVSINKGSDVATASRPGVSRQGLNQSWHFELTLLPEEIIDFLPWVVNLVKSYDEGSASFVQDPPHPFRFQTSNLLLFDNAQTRKAGSRLSQQFLSREYSAPRLAALAGRL